MSEPLHAPVPPADCGTPDACLDLLPAGDYDTVQLTSPYLGSTDLTERLDALLDPLGLPTGRLILRDGLHVITGRDGQRWLAVDYLVPGVRGADGTGWDVQLNSEAGRAADGDADAAEAALDRWFAPLDQPLPEWLVPITGRVRAAMDAVHAAARDAHESRLGHDQRVAAAQQQLADVLTEEAGRG